MINTGITSSTGNLSHCHEALGNCNRESHLIQLQLCQPILYIQNIFASYSRLNILASTNRYGVDTIYTIWQTISSCYPELINFLHCPTTVHCVSSRSWIQARDERTGWKAVINLSRLRALLCSVCQPGSRLWMKYWLDGAHLPHYTLTHLTDRERERKQQKWAFINPIFDLENWKSVFNAIIINLSYNYKCTFLATSSKPKSYQPAEKNMQNCCS